MQCFINLNFKPNFKPNVQPFSFFFFPFYTTCSEVRLFFKWYWQQYLNKKKLEEMGEKTGAVLEIEKNVDIHNKVMALLFPFPSLPLLPVPNCFGLWNIHGNSISFSVPIFKCSTSKKTIV